MNELTIGPGDEASLSMGTLMGDMEERDHLPGTLRERCKKFWRQVSLALGARWGICGVVDRVFLEGSRWGASLSMGALLRELLSGDLEGYGRRARGNRHHLMGVH